MIDTSVLVNLAAAGALFAIGLYCIVAKANLIRMVLGLEFLGKGVSVTFILGGYLAGDVATSQAVVFTLIAIEAVTAAVALGLVILARRTFLTLDVSEIAAKTLGGEK